MKHFCAVLALVLLTSCAGGFYHPSATARLPCAAEQCQALWAQAQTWLAKNSRYRFQIVNDNVIHTHGPHDGVYDGVAYTLTREPRANGGSMIVITGTCSATVYGCVIDPAPYVNALYHYLHGPQ